jgi:hypothetical protein
MQPKHLEEIDAIIENGVGEIYRGFFRLHQAGEIQEEYNQMGAILLMLMEDRQNLRTNYKVVDE